MTSWNVVSWIGGDSHKEEREALKKIHAEMHNLILEKSWKLNRVPYWKPYWPTPEAEKRNTILNIIRTKEYYLNSVSEEWYSYWPTPEEELWESIRSFDIDELCKMDPVETRIFLERLKNSLDIAAVEERIKNVGNDNGFSITDTEYINAFNKIVELKWNENYCKVYKLNVSMMAISLAMSFMSEQPGFYWGVFLTGTINLLKNWASYPSKFE